MANVDLLPGAMRSRTPIDESTALLAFDRDIVFAARHQARRFPNSDYLADELAQRARVRVLNVLRTQGDASIAYLRTTIANAVRTPPSRDLALERSMEVDPEIPDDHVEDDFLASGVVRTWIDTLPLALRVTYELLFVQELTQREAAKQLAVSQPRVAQLRAQLLARGKHELSGLAN